ncbi:MAG: hypothetical protein GTO53_07685 [Planctomycetales bacterium]|nr:hypothetical protein [Planctomycetales bacterium]NIM09018.1 hypothetical protein [Planctomycetales bacterium]NIN08481.1 hypothetical protein [Planctomycetales bacterium]NIN77615.1 hypothetical protein [Planctomycetales bacterium]NIO34778.1 hypothetical protein [Planctomycetales bacterium]
MGGRPVRADRGHEDRQQEVADRLELWTGSRAVSGCGFPVMGDHLLLLVGCDPGAVPDPFDLRADPTE